MKRLAAQLMAKVSALTPDTLWGEIALILTDHPGMIEIHEACMGKSHTTDVLTLRYDPVPGETSSEVNVELIINVQRAMDMGQQSCPGRKTRVPWGECREFALYIAHGCDHLTGADDGDRHGRERMRKRELRWLSEAHDSGLVEGLLHAGPVGTDP